MLSRDSGRLYHISRGKYLVRASLRAVGEHLVSYQPPQAGRSRVVPQSPPSLNAEAHSVGPQPIYHLGASATVRPTLAQSLWST